MRPTPSSFRRPRMRGEVAFEDVSFRYPVAAGQVEVTAEMAEAEAEGRAVPSQVMPFALADLDVHRRARAARRARRAVGQRQDDLDLPHPAALRRRLRLGARSTASTCAASGSSRSGEVIGFVTQETYLFHDTVLANLRYAKPDATMDEIEAAARAAAIHERIMELPDALRHGGRRARLQAVGRREAARGDRARAAQGSAHPHPGRGDVGARHGQRAAHPVGAGAADGGPHHDRHRPPAVDDPARRPDPRHGARPHRRARHACRAHPPGRASTRSSTRSSSPSRHGAAERMPNRLADETSPYLLQHAHNPVDWYPWGAGGARASAQRRTSRSSSPSATRPATGATSWSASRSRTPRSRRS